MATDARDLTHPPRTMQRLYARPNDQKRTYQALPQVRCPECGRQVEHRRGLGLPDCTGPKVDHDA